MVCRRQLTRRLPRELALTAGACVMDRACPIFEQIRKAHEDQGTRRTIHSLSDALFTAPGDKHHAGWKRAGASAPDCGRAGCGPCSCLFFKQWQKAHEDQSAACLVHSLFRRLHTGHGDNRTPLYSSCLIFEQPMKASWNQCDGYAIHSFSGALYTLAGDKRATRTGAPRLRLGTVEDGGERARVGKAGGEVAERPSPGRIAQAAGTEQLRHGAGAA